MVLTIIGIMEQGSHLADLLQFWCKTHSFTCQSTVTVDGQSMIEAMSIVYVSESVSESRNR
jgi:hypothetical protein